MHLNKFPNGFLLYLDEHTLIGIKGGTKRDRFLDIWMIRVGDRVFARSWEKSKRSWFTAFAEEGIGQIKYGNKTIDVNAKPCDDVMINKQIDAAYKQKYNSSENQFYANGITQPEYIHYTMEFFNLS